MTEIRQITRHPLFLDAKGQDKEEVVVALVERQDKPGALGAAMRGARYVVPLPDGYDMQTSIRYVNGKAVVAHPSLPALLVDFTTHSYSLIDDVYVEARPGRMKLAK